MHKRKSAVSGGEYFLGTCMPLPIVHVHVDAHHLGRSECFLNALTCLSVCWWSWYGGFQVFFSCFSGKTGSRTLM